MKYLHLTEDADGVSHFADVEMTLAPDDFAPPAPAMLASVPEACARLRFLALPPGWGGPRHRSPRRQVAFCLMGRMRVEAGDGEVREIGPGGVWRMEDVTGSGHSSAVIGDDEVRLAIVQLD